MPDPSLPDTQPPAPPARDPRLPTLQLFALDEPSPHEDNPHGLNPSRPGPSEPDLHRTIPSGAGSSTGHAAQRPDQQAADACFARGVALAGSGHALQAAQQFQHANLLWPDHPAILTNLGLLLSHLDQHDTALACVRRAIDLRPDDPRAALALATVLYRQGNIFAAIPAHRRAVALAPDNPIAWTALGDCQVAVGQHTEAIACFRQALTLDPDQLAARRSLAACGPPGTRTEDIAHLSALLARKNLPTEDRITVGFTLGQMLNTEGRFDEAFASFAAANALVLTTQAEAGHRFDAATFDAAIDRLIAAGTEGAGTQGFLAHATEWGNRSELPVFIVGMPRSGSTLVEQIAASHSQVFGAGESKALAHAIEALAQASSPRQPIDWDPTAARALADRHLADLAAQAAGAGTGIARVLDKMLDNVFHLGLIAALFPNARVIICRRDLRDVCLSCYFRRFADPNLYAYELLSCARRAQAIERLIAHWRAVLPLRMHEVVYESLVARSTEEIGRLIDFLGLEQEPACLEAHRTERVVTTASAWQVRQPINAQSVGQWRLYRRHLGPLLEVLGEDP